MAKCCTNLEMAYQAEFRYGKKGFNNSIGECCKTWLANIANSSWIRPKYLLGTLKVVLIGCVKNQGRYPNSWSKNYSKNVAKFGQKIVAKFGRRKVRPRNVRLKNIAKSKWDLIWTLRAVCIGREIVAKFGQEKCFQTSARKMLQNRPKMLQNRLGHSCDQFFTCYRTSPRGFLNGKQIRTCPSIGTTVCTVVPTSIGTTWTLWPIGSFNLLMGGLGGSEPRGLP